jgi:hypothetical protein
VRHDQRRPVGRLDHFGSGVGFARSGNAQQNLMLLPIKHSSTERLDGLCLIALRLVAAYEFEVHTPL